MTFYEYMVRKYIKKKNSGGDLARDMVRDAELSNAHNIYNNDNAQYDTIYGYLIIKGACKECIKTFKKCWEKYLKEKSNG